MSFAMCRDTCVHATLKAAHGFARQRLSLSEEGGLMSLPIGLCALW